MSEHVHHRADDRLRRADGGRRRTGVRGVLVTAPVGALAAVTLSATAAAAQASAGVQRLRSTAAPATDRVAPTGVDPAATCHYRVNHAGGIRIYKQKAVGPYWGSLANGATFYATCDNSNGEAYSDCPGGTSVLWKTVNAGGSNTGYVRTKCLVRV